MTCSVDIIQPSPSATPDWHRGPMGGAATVSERKNMWPQQHGLPLTKTDLVTAPSECPNCYQQKPIHQGPIPQGNQLAT